MMNVVIAKPAHSSELSPKIVNDLIAAPHDNIFKNISSTEFEFQRKKNFLKDFPIGMSMKQNNCLSGYSQNIKQD